MTLRLRMLEPLDDHEREPVPTYDPAMHERARQLARSEARRVESDAALLTEETDEGLRDLVGRDVGEVSETTRELARLELESRGVPVDVDGGTKGQA